MHHTQNYELKIKMFKNKIIKKKSMQARHQC